MGTVAGRVAMTATGAFATSLLTSFLIFCGLVVAFGVLSRWKSNYNIYFPSRILSASVAKFPVPVNPLAWVKEALLTPEVELIRIAGLDAAIYLNFFTAGSYIVPAIPTT